MTRSSQVPELGSMAGPTGAAFNLKPGEISGPLNLGDKGAVLEVTDRQEPSTSDPTFTAQRDQLMQQLMQQKQQQAVMLFMSNLDERLKKEGKLKINNAELNSLTKNRG
jgi:parvulin-like peptidyl-prolyl isomerase